MDSSGSEEAEVAQPDYDHSEARVSVIEVESHSKERWVRLAIRRKS